MENGTESNENEVATPDNSMGSKVSTVFNNVIQSKLVLLKPKLFKLFVSYYILCTLVECSYSFNVKTIKVLHK